MRSECASSRPRRSTDSRGASGSPTTPCEKLRNRADHGEIDADLGAGVIKQRIARTGEGKSRGFRTIILFRRKDGAFFVYGFSKADRATIRRDELHAFRALARELLGLKDGDLSVAVRRGAIREVE